MADTGGSDSSSNMLQITLISERAKLPTEHGMFEAIAFMDNKGNEHFALIAEPLPEVPFVRVHSECLTGDIMSSTKCDCGTQLEEAQKRIAEEGGIVIYLRGHEGRGIGLVNKINAYNLQDQGRDTVDANTELELPIDARTYEIAAETLTYLGVTRIRLLSNNPAKANGLTSHGIKVIEVLPLTGTVTPENKGYLLTKGARLNHKDPTGAQRKTH